MSCMMCNDSMNLYEILDEVTDEPTNCYICKLCLSKYPNIKAIKLDD